MPARMLAGTNQLTTQDRAPAQYRNRLPACIGCAASCLQCCREWKGSIWWPAYLYCAHVHVLLLACGAQYSNTSMLVARRNALPHLRRSRPVSTAALSSSCCLLRFSALPFSFMLLAVLACAAHGLPMHGSPHRPAALVACPDQPCRHACPGQPCADVPVQTSHTQTCVSRPAKCRRACPDQQYADMPVQTSHACPAMQTWSLPS